MPPMFNLVRLLHRVVPMPDDPARWSPLDKLRCRSMAVITARLATGARSGDMAEALASLTRADVHGAKLTRGTFVGLARHKTALSAQGASHTRTLWLEELPADSACIDAHRWMQVWCGYRMWATTNGQWSDRSGLTDRLFGVNSETLSRDVRCLLVAAGWRDPRSHALRGGALSYLNSLGHDLGDLRQLFGWSGPDAAVRRFYERAHPLGQAWPEAMAKARELGAVFDDDSWLAGDTIMVFDAETNPDPPCMICGRTEYAANFVLCEDCSRGGHTTCMGLSGGVPLAEWRCAKCARRYRAAEEQADAVDDVDLPSFDLDNNEALDAECGDR
jgi:hypothetical protein